ncbi:MAG: 4-alpha-glucanotransferase [Chloroflexi bacterium GWB2_49_20]|nr:MAG: 4-alpha-glucanotransferase [Chloroflexi bacterium GWB2_49_20]OGN78984.1 MAG: 4-alpha-glucanotransferase [Chloroflexi bacterium GWC2_49_37]OGN86255.1 MAG: 4-alpha-glucanotransferase [Chloroflexi bacterium GWD2_49_16]
MKFERSSGILFHPTSLPGKYGIGDLGSSAFALIDFLKEIGCSLWQILPLGPTGYGNSPYQSFSAFAGNPYLISPDILFQEGLLHSNDLVEETRFSQTHVEYGRIIPWKLNLLERAFNKFFDSNSLLRNDYDAFCDENVYWLEDFALFMAQKEAFGGGSWTNWPEPFRVRKPAFLNKARKNLKHSVERYKFYQFLFFRQWISLKSYAHNSGIKIIGDIPLYVAHDSADVWANSELFLLDTKGRPTVVAGVPPDYFSPTGQLWGNPIYQWDEHRATGFKWWIERLRWTLYLVDVVRLDHFRGFAGYWEVPAEKSTAEYGRWVQGPGIEFFRQMEKALDREAGLPLVAEDLGVITQDVIKLRDQLKLPGMKILQFAFSGSDNSFLPHHYSPNCVVYTGTHDNDTTTGWFNSAPERERLFAKDYLGVDGSDMAWDLIRAGWASVAVYALAPMQDFLKLDSKARMNYPSRIGGNWEWRMSEHYKDDGLIERLKKYNVLYGRS